MTDIPKSTQQKDSTDAPTEAIARLRRIETRVTQLAIAAGIMTQSTPPVFHMSTPARSAYVELPSPRAALDGVIDAIPVGWAGPVALRFKGELIGTLSFPDAPDTGKSSV